jgi:hypothetical protein
MKLKEDELKTLRENWSKNEKMLDIYKENVTTLQKVVAAKSNDVSEADRKRVEECEAIEKRLKEEMTANENLATAMT